MYRGSWQNGGVTLEKMTSRHQPTQRGTKVHIVGVTVLLAASLALGGCSFLPSGMQASDPTQTAAGAAPAQDGTEAEVKPPEPQSAAQELSGKVKESLATLAAGAKSPTREQMMAAMLAAGAVQEKVELSLDITPTGLAVDAIEAATPVAEECVIGQVRDGHVTVTILPVLASGLCFVGSTH